MSSINHQTTLFILLCLIVINLCCEHEYIVPKPKITIYKPCGFSVSVPDSPGITIFAFHGNINKPMEYLEAGHFSRDIIKKNKNRWVFKDTKTVLEVGDTIYYWLFVVRNKLGYRLDDGVFEVTDILPAPEGFYNSQYSKPNINRKPPTSQVAPTAIDEDEHEEHNYDYLKNLRELYQTCQMKTANLTITNEELVNNIDSLKETVRILKEVINKNNSNIKLVISGQLPSESDPMSFVNVFLREKLKLTNIGVISAEKINGNIEFHVNDINNKLAIIEATKKHLQDSKFSLSY